MSGSEARKFAKHHLRSWKILFRYLAFPLRLVRHLLHTLLQLYSRITSTRLQRIHTNGRPEQISGLSQLQTQCNGQLSPLPGSGLACSTSILPTHSASPSFPHSLPAPSSSTRAQQLPHAALPRADPFTPSEVLRYDKPPSMWAFWIMSGSWFRWGNSKRTDKREFIEPLTTDYSEWVPVFPGMKTSSHRLQYTRLWNLACSCTPWRSALLSWPKSCMTCIIGTHSELSH